MIIPKIFPYPDNIQRHAEKKVFEALKKIPDKNGFDIFYNKIIYNDVNPGYSEDGEADFVIFHAELGFMVIEVKGGEIFYDADKDQWFSKTLKSQNTYKIKNPYKQATTNKYAILKKFKELWQKGRPPSIDAKRMIVFPDVPFPDEFLGIGFPDQLLVCGDQIDNIEGHISRIFLINERGPHTIEKPGEPGRKIFQDMFAKSFELKRTLKLNVSEGKKYISILDNQQKEILNLTSKINRAAFEGGAGTGKSFLAAQKAIKLSEQGKTVALVCGINKPFALHTKKELKNFSNIHVDHFHGFCKFFFDISNSENIENSIASFEFYENNLLNSIEKSTKKFDALIIDEAQDLNEDSINSLLFCLKDPDQGTAFLFFDNNQKIYNSKFSLNSFVKSSLTLNKNYRNSKDIFDLNKFFYHGSNFVSHGPEGEVVQFIEVNSNNLLKKNILKLINKYKLEGVDYSDIAVLTGSKFGKSSELCKTLNIENSFFITAEELTKTGVVLDSIKRFKGLEKDIIILIEIEEVLDFDQLMYVGLSRARLVLDIISNSKVINFLKSSLIIKT